uniref:Uncharacterized protein n=1 Tax=Romanomermis culicivorax TaxID=13658 RepID=A0A915J1L3_ROMCU
MKPAPAVQDASRRFSCTIGFDQSPAVNSASLSSSSLNNNNNTGKNNTSHNNGASNVERGSTGNLCGAKGSPGKRLSANLLLAIPNTLSPSSALVGGSASRSSSPRRTDRSGSCPAHQLRTKFAELFGANINTELRR